MASDVQVVCVCVCVCRVAFTNSVFIHSMGDKAEYEGTDADRWLDVERGTCKSSILSIYPYTNTHTHTHTHRQWFRQTKSQRKMRFCLLTIADSYALRFAVILWSFCKSLWCSHAASLSFHSFHFIPSLHPWGISPALAMHHMVLAVVKIRFK